MQVASNYLKHLFFLTFGIVSLLYACDNDNSDQELIQDVLKDIDEQQANSITEPKSEQILGVDSAKNYTDKELNEFIVALKAVQVIQQSFQPKMMQIIASEGLTIERYEQIAQQMQTGQQSDQTEEEKTMIESIHNQFEAMQSEQKVKFDEAIEETGVKLEDYLSILSDLQQNQQLQQRVEQMIREDEAANAVSAP